MIVLLTALPYSFTSSRDQRIVTHCTGMLIVRLVGKIAIDKKNDNEQIAQSLTNQVWSFAAILDYL